MEMIENMKVISALHCRAQDLMIDLPACDGCDYQVQFVRRIGCDFRRLCKDAVELLKDQPEIVRCKDCVYWHQSPTEQEWGDCGQANGLVHCGEFYCADGVKKDE